MSSPDVAVEVYETVDGALSLTLTPTPDATAAIEVGISGFSDAVQRREHGTTIGVTYVNEEDAKISLDFSSNWGIKPDGVAYYGETLPDERCILQVASNGSVYLVKPDPLAPPEPLHVHSINGEHFGDVVGVAMQADVDAALAAKAAEDSVNYAVKAGTTLLAYDRFDRYSDGPFDRMLPLTGPEYHLSGTGTPMIVNGAATTPTSSGYIYLGFDVAPTYVEEVVSWEPGTSLGSTATMAWAKESPDAGGYGGSGSLDDLLHPTFGPSGFSCTLRNGGGTFDGIMSGAWSVPCLTDGTRYRIGMGVRGNTLLIVGPNGEMFAATDPRIGYLASSTVVFWEPVAGSSGGRCNLHEIRVLRHEPQALEEASSLISALDALIRPGVVVAQEDSWWESRLGQNGSGHPAVSLGPSGGVGTVRSVLTHPVGMGATTIVTTTPLPPGPGVLGNGTIEGEVITISGNPNPLPGAGSTYTATLTAPTTRAYPAGTSVWASGYGRAEIYYNKFDGIVKLQTDQSMQIRGDVYVGTTADVRLVRSSAGVLGVALGAGSAAAGKGAFKFPALTTANRPVAATVGAGATVFDSTLGCLITSDGTNWRNGIGTIV